MRVDLEGTIYQLQRPLEFATLKVGYTGHVKRIEVVRRDGEDLVVQPKCLFEPSGLLGSERLTLGARRRIRLLRRGGNGRRQRPGAVL